MNVPEAVDSPGSVAGLLRILRYRRYLAASTLLSISLWTFQVALSWTLLEQSGSAVVVGLLQMSMSIAIPIVTIPAGILVDRLGPRDLVVVCYAALAGCVALLAVFAAADLLTVPVALAIAIVFGLFDGLSVTPQAVLVGRLVPRPRMAAAISFSTIAFGIGRVVGGPLGGALLVVSGAATSLGVAAVGIAMAGVLLLTVPRPIALAGGERPRLSDIGESWRWARTSRSALALFALGAVAALLLWPYLTLLPVVARDLVSGEAGELGWFVAAGGIGAILAAFLTERLGRLVGRGRLVVGSLLTGGVLLVVLANVHEPVTALPVAVLVAGAIVTWTATTTVLLQALAPPPLRGRVLALHGVIFFAFIPVGMIVASIVADLIGIVGTLVLLGLATCSGVLVTLLFDRSLLDRRLEVGLDTGIDAGPERPPAFGALSEDA